MKGQQSFEFLVIIFILVSYLAVVFGLFADVRASLQKAVDKKAVSTIQTWTEFIYARPEGTQIKFEISPFPGRYVSLSCGARLQISAPKYTVNSVSASCPDLNITGSTCLSIEKIEGGVKIEVC